MRRRTVTGVLIRTLAVLCLWTGCAGARAQDPSAPPVPVLVELFTSQGCSSCPPADALLSELHRDQPIEGVRIVTLSRHVDYWDGLGWKDPYSSAAATQRQREYAAGVGSGRIYTPQMVVDGAAEFVGNDRTAAKRTISAAARRPKQAVEILDATLDRASGSILVRVRVPGAPAVTRGDVVEVWLAVAEDGLGQDVRRGENAGRHLAHDSVARRIESFGVIEDAGFDRTQPVDFDKTWDASKTSVIAFLQERNGQRVLGIATRPLETSANSGN